MNDKVQIKLNNKTLAVFQLDNTIIVLWNRSIGIKSLLVCYDFVAFLEREVGTNVKRNRTLFSFLDIRNFFLENFYAFGKYSFCCWASIPENIDSMGLTNLPTFDSNSRDRYLFGLSFLSFDCKDISNKAPPFFNSL